MLRAPLQSALPVTKEVSVNGPLLPLQPVEAPQSFGQARKAGEGQSKGQHGVGTFVEEEAVWARPSHHPSTYSRA